MPGPAPKEHVTEPGGRTCPLGTAGDPSRSLFTITPTFTEVSRRDRVPETQDGCGGGEAVTGADTTVLRT